MAERVGINPAQIFRRLQGRQEARHAFQNWKRLLARGAAQRAGHDLFTIKLSGLQTKIYFALPAFNQLQQRLFHWFYSRGSVRGAQQMQAGPDLRAVAKSIGRINLPDTPVWPML